MSTCIFYEGSVELGEKKQGRKHLCYIPTFFCPATPDVAASTIEVTVIFAEEAAHQIVQIRELHYFALQMSEQKLLLLSCFQSNSNKLQAAHLTL